MSNLPNNLGDDVTLVNPENLQNASALLALLHGKSDSICKVFDKEIMVTLSELKKLNSMIHDKLSIHNVDCITTSLDISLSNKKILTFKSWNDLECYDFKLHNSPITSVFIQWDFFISIQGLKFSQRHTINVRISSSPRPSEFFKVILSGALDDENDIEMRMHTTICKVDFINNTLAEELVTVVQSWNELCESAVSQKSKLTKFVFKFSEIFSATTEFSFLTSLVLIFALAVKYLLEKGYFSFTNENLFFVALFFLPLYKLFASVARASGKGMHRKLMRVMQIHIFNITAGDKKRMEKINKTSTYKKEVFVFFANIIVTILVSLCFFIADFTVNS